MEREDITFLTSDGTRLAGWLYRPPATDRLPGLIILTHGFTVTRDMGLDAFARAFVDAGYAALVYDHRCFGDSGGEPRGEANPWLQISDMRDAISYARNLDHVDPDRIGLWGTSFSGGHVIVVAATDRRVKCVVAQVPVVAGYSNFAKILPAPQLATFLEAIASERDARARGDAPTYITVSAEESETYIWTKKASDGRYPNTCTLLSRDMYMGYEPGGYIKRVSPTPFLMIVATQDTRTPIDDQLEAYGQALEPKALELVRCGHYTPYESDTAAFTQCEGAARRWFETHL